MTPQCADFRHSRPSGVPVARSNFAIQGRADLIVPVARSSQCLLASAESVDPGPLGAGPPPQAPWGPPEYPCMPDMVPVRRLDVEHVAAQPRDIDWEREFSDDDASWSKASRCESCRKPVAGSGGGRHAVLDENETECMGHVPTSEGPMMAHFYACDWGRRGTIEDAALALVDLPLCPVQLADGTRGIALTGGGMDLSWEICAAYVALGFLPPLHFAGHLPTMAGMYLDRKRRRTLLACERSASVAAGWARGAVTRIRKMRRTMSAKGEE